MGGNTHIKYYGNKLKFLNRTKVKFDWDNDELIEDNGLIED